MGGRHVALIRGINVGRGKRVAMTDLRELLKELGYGEVRTLLNSGNVVFDAGREKPGRIGRRIEKGMSEELGVSAAVTVLASADFSTVVDENSLGDGARDPSRLLVAFCADPGRLTRLEPLMEEDWSPEALARGSVAAYLWCPAGVLASRLPEAVGRALGDSATIRNWKTVTRIQAALPDRRHESTSEGS